MWNEFEKVGARVLISKPDKILICRDKNNTGEFFQVLWIKGTKKLIKIINRTLVHTLALSNRRMEVFHHAFKYKMKRS
jgi:carbamoylphosphate synthase large subunit